MRKSIFSTLDFHPEKGGTLSDLYKSAHEHAQLAEKLGFNCVWIAEHHFHNIGSVPNPAVLLSSLAQCTKTIRIGPAIAILPFRNARETAENYAMVDLISGGRLNMGVGIGNSKAEFDAAEVEFEQRREVLTDNLTELKRLWCTPYNTSFDSLNITPVQNPAPRIYISTITAESAYLAGQNGDSVLTIIPPTADDLSNLKLIIEAHKDGLAQSNADTSKAELVVTAYAHAAKDEEQAFQTAVSSFETFMKVASGKDTPNMDTLCRKMITTNSAFIGTSEQISKQVNEYKKMGVDHISFLCNFGGMSSDQVKESITCLASC